MTAYSLGRLSLFAALLHAGFGHAQTSITGTQGQGNLGTNVAAPVGGVYDITGGTRPGNGPNLFHSFGAFSVGAGDTANFSNNTGLYTSNIIGRVTGGQTSNIFGTISTTGFTNPDLTAASLYLINPAGWVFGAGSALQVEGSFHASTAHYMRFADGAQFFADPAQASVLTSASPLAFGFLGPTAPIVVDGTFLQVNPGQTLSFVGGDVTISGAAYLFAPSGRVQVGSFASAGEANVDGLSGTFASLGVINMTGGSIIDVSAYDATQTPLATPSGNVMIRGGQLIMDSGSMIISNNFGDIDGGTIDLSLSQSISLSTGSTIGTMGSADSGFGIGRGGDIHLAAPDVKVDGSFVLTQTAGDAAAGNLSLQAGTLAVTTGGAVGSVTQGNGRGGDVNISASQSITIDGHDNNPHPSPSSIFTQSIGPADAGQLTLSTGLLMMSDTASIISATTGGRAGDINLTVGTLSMDTGATINSHSQGSGGNINVVATGPVTLTGDTTKKIQTGIYSDTCPICPVAGDIVVHGKTITLTDGALIQSGSVIQPGGGSLTLAATEGIAISGRSGVSTQGSDVDVNPLSISSQTLVVDNGFISTTTTGKGRAGNIAVQVGAITLMNGGQIASSTEGVSLLNTGSGGGVSVMANTISISGSSPNGVPVISSSNSANSGIFSTAHSRGNGNAGQINLTAASLSLMDGGTISVATTTGGAAGNVALNVTSLLNMASRGTVNSSTSASGAGGAIGVNASSATIAGAGTGLFSTASNTGNAGQITITGSMLSIADRGTISVSTSAGGAAGNVALNVGSVSMASGATVNSSTSGSGAGGAIALNASTTTIAGTGTGLFSTASNTGNAGHITVSGGGMTVADGARISTSTTGAGNAGTITANVGTMTVTGGGLDSNTSAAGNGGAINVNAGGEASVVNAGRISADSTGSGTTGNITIVAGDRITMDGGSISTRAVTSDGGDITLKAPNIVRLEDAQITTSVQSGVGKGGNVLIDPQFVLMNKSSITANAFGGPGGNITIVTANFLKSATSLVQASSALSTPGTIEIKSPENNIPSSIAQLPRAFADASRLMRGACSARREGAPSSFVLAGRGGVPAEADGYLPSTIVDAPPTALSLAYLDDCVR